MSINDVEAPETHSLAFEPGEMKKVSLGFREVNGKVEILVASTGAHDDINEIAKLLAFALEKILEE
jgi:hypothetical protein